MTGMMIDLVSRTTGKTPVRYAEASRSSIISEVE